MENSLWQHPGGHTKREISYFTMGSSGGEVHKYVIPFDSALKLHLKRADYVLMLLVYDSINSFSNLYKNENISPGWTITDGMCCVVWKEHIEK